MTARLKISRLSYSVAVFIVLAFLCLFLPALVASQGGKDFLDAFLEILTYPGERKLWFTVVPADFKVSFDLELDKKNTLHCLEEVLHPIQENETLDLIYEHCLPSEPEIGFPDLINKILLQIFLICTGSMLISDNFKTEQKPAWRRSTMSREASQVNLIQKSGSSVKFSRASLPDDLHWTSFPVPMELVSFN